MKYYNKTPNLLINFLYYIKNLSISLCVLFIKIFTSFTKLLKLPIFSPLRNIDSIVLQFSTIRLFQHFYLIFKQNSLSFHEYNKNITTNLKYILHIRNTTSLSNNHKLLGANYENS